MIEDPTKKEVGKVSEKAKDSPEETQAETEKKPENMAAEDAEIEMAIENNKEKIKSAAEDWLIKKEEELKSAGEEREKRFAKIGKIAGATLMAMPNIIGLSNLLEKVDAYGSQGYLVLVGAIVAVGGGYIFGEIGGILSGKMVNYFKRRKFNKQKEKIEEEQSLETYRKLL